MEKSVARQQLENAAGVREEKIEPLASFDNHDRVNITIGLSNAEAADKIADSINRLIASNEAFGKSNERYAKASKRLALALILVTLVVGLLQMYIIWRTGVQKATSEGISPRDTGQGK